MFTVIGTIAKTGQQEKIQKQQLFKIDNVYHSKLELSKIF